MTSRNGFDIVFNWVSLKEKIKRIQSYFVFFNLTLELEPTDFNSCSHKSLNILAFSSCPIPFGLWFIRFTPLVLSNFFQFPVVYFPKCFSPLFPSHYITRGESGGTWFSLSVLVGRHTRYQAQLRGSDIQTVESEADSERGLGPLTASRFTRPAPFLSRGSPGWHMKVLDDWQKPKIYSLFFVRSVYLLDWVSQVCQHCGR